jgi:hypothetical protein
MVMKCQLEILIERDHMTNKAYLEGYIKIDFEEIGMRVWI